MNKQVVLNVLRKELKREEENLLFHKAQIAYLWEMCDVAKKNNPYMLVFFQELNRNKELARQTKRKLKSIRESIKFMKNLVIINMDAFDV
jgi:hypothetical protein